MTSQKVETQPRYYHKDPICWALGHIEVPAEDKPGWTSIFCGRCGKNVMELYPWQKVYGKIRWSIPETFLWLANKTYPKSIMAHYPVYRAIDQHTDGIGTEHSCGAYSYEHLKGLVEQDGPDGFGATATIAWLIDESGWVNITEDNSEEMLDLINKDFEAQSNKIEREETMKIIHGEKD